MGLSDPCRLLTRIKLFLLVAVGAGQRGPLPPEPVVNREYLRKDILSFLIPWTLTLFAAGALCVWEISGGQSVFTPVSVLGLFLFVIGMVPVFVAHVTLWQWYSSFLVIKDGHQLIRHGIYRYLRHPIYTGTI